MSLSESLRETAREYELLAEWHRERVPVEAKIPAELRHAIGDALASGFALLALKLADEVEEREAA